MKITILGPAHPFRGGIAAFGERLAREFQAEGHEVDLVTFTLQYPSFLFPGSTQYSVELAPSDLKIRRLLNSINPFSWISTGRKIRNEAPDILVVQFWLPFMAPSIGTVSRIAKRNHKTEVVTILHNFIPHDKKVGDAVFIKYFSGSVDRYVTLSKSVMADIGKVDRVKPRCVCPHPLYDNFGEAVSREEACRHLNLDPADRYILFFGLIRDYKGLDLLLEAYSKVSDKAKLIVAGEFYGDPVKYHSLAESLGIDDKVIWRTVFVPDSEVRYYFCAANLVAQTYKTASQSGVTQIAYHFEKPMLVTNVGGLAEIVPDKKVGYAVDPTPEAIAEALSDFLDKSPDFTEGIRSEKNKYSWVRMAEAVAGKRDLQESQ